MTIDGGFLQSNHWANFQKSIGREVVITEEDDLHALMIKHKLPLVGEYFFVPRGPIFKSQPQKGLEKLLEVAKKEKVGWIRFEPQTDEDLKIIDEFLKEEKVKLVKAKKNHQPPETLMLDLNSTEDELLAQMKSKTRYNIRLSKKKEVEVFNSRKNRHIKEFLKLSHITAKRDKIVLHPDGYYKKMFKEIPEDNLKLYLAEFKGEIIGAILVSFYGGVATYLHGASGNSHRNVMAPYGLQWQAICDAKEKGFKKYDFGGIRSEDQNKNSQRKVGGASWAGVTRFKKGFCPLTEPVKFPGCYDAVLSPFKYKAYRSIQKGKTVLTNLTKMLK